jgi:homoserine kinase type II
VAPEPAIDPAVALQQWSLPEPWSVDLASAGANNTSLFVGTPVDRYVLRLYAQGDPASVRYEHGLLVALTAAELPFAVPLPVLTRDGQTFARVAMGESEVLASLTPVLPGTHPDPDNLRHVRLAGVALARLGQALASIVPPAGWAQYRPFGDLRRFHPLLDDPTEAIAAIPGLEEPDKRRLREMVAVVEDIAPSLYAQLPRRIIHRDYYAPNVLLTDGAVSAVLDFEFAGEDLRALDVAVVLAWWPLWGTEQDRWSVCEAFARGYASVEPLAPAEAEAVPTLARLQFATFLMHSVGRYRGGLAGWGEIATYVAQLVLTFLAWLTPNEPLLTERLVAWTAHHDEVP